MMQRFFAILAGGGAALRGHGRQVHRRRDHGRVRRPGRPRGPRAARLLRGPADARRRRRVRGRAAARARAQLLGAGRAQLRRGGRRGDRRRRGRRVHGDRPHGRAGAADGGAGRAGQGLPDREHGGAGARLHGARGPRRVRDQGRQPARARLRAGRGRRGALAPRPLARARLLALRRPREPRWRRWRRRWPGPRAGEGAAVGIVAEAGVGKSRLCHEFAERARERGIEVFECAGPGARPARSPSCRCCRCCAPTSASATREPERIVREKIAGRTLLLDPDFAAELPLLFDFLGVPDPERPSPR